MKQNVYYHFFFYFVWFRCLRIPKNKNFFYSETIIKANYKQNYNILIKDKKNSKMFVAEICQSIILCFIETALNMLFDGRLVIIC